MWMVLKRYGVPDHMQKLIISFHNDMHMHVRVDNEIGEPFNVTNGLRQGCIMAPVLFSMYAAAMVDYWKRHLPEDEIYVKMRSIRGGCIPFHSVKGKQLYDSVNFQVLEFQYADDMAIIAPTYERLYQLIEGFHEMAMKWGMVLSFKKTKIMAIGHEGNLDDMNFGENTVEAVESFTYLGSVLHQSVTARNAVFARIGKACKSFGILWKSIFGRRDVSLEIKKEVYLSVVWGTLLYGAETWNLKKEDERNLEVFHRRCVRSMFRISRHNQWKKHISHETLCSRMKITRNICTHIRRLRMYWLSNIVCMPQYRLPRLATYGFFSSVRNKVGRPHKRWVELTRKDLEWFGYNPDLCGWYVAARDFQNWHCDINECTEKRTVSDEEIEVPLPCPEENAVQTVAKQFDCLDWKEKPQKRWFVGYIRYQWTEEEPFNENNALTHVVYEDGMEEDMDSLELSNCKIAIAGGVGLSMLWRCTVKELREIARFFDISLRQASLKGDIIAAFGSEFLKTHGHDNAKGKQLFSMVSKVE